MARWSFEAVLAFAKSLCMILMTVSASGTAAVNLEGMSTEEVRDLRCDPVCDSAFTDSSTFCHHLSDFDGALP